MPNIPRAGMVESDSGASSDFRCTLKGEQTKMLRWAVIFLVIAIIAALLGFGGIAGTASSIALILFWVFLAVTVILFLVGLVGGGRRPVI